MHLLSNIKIIVEIIKTGRYKEKIVGWPYPTLRWANWQSRTFKHEPIKKKYEVHIGLAAFSYLLLHLMIAIPEIILLLILLFVITD